MSERESKGRRSSTAAAEETTPLRSSAAPDSWSPEIRLSRGIAADTFGGGSGGGTNGGGDYSGGVGDDDDLPIGTAGFRWSRTSCCVVFQLCSAMITACLGAMFSTRSTTVAILGVRYNWDMAQKTRACFLAALVSAVVAAVLLLARLFDSWMDRHTSRRFGGPASAQSPLVGAKAAGVSFLSPKSKFAAMMDEPNDGLGLRQSGSAASAATGGAYGSDIAAGLSSASTVVGSGVSSATVSRGGSDALVVDAAGSSGKKGGNGYFYKMVSS